VAGTESTPRQCFVSPAPTRYARDASRLAGSPSPRARTVNAKRWVRNAQAMSRCDRESKPVLRPKGVSKHPRARTVNAKRWVQNAQAVSRFPYGDAPRLTGRAVQF